LHLRLRSIHTVVLGGTKQRGDFSLHPRQVDSNFIGVGAAAMMPAALEAAELAGEAVGLRPGRGADGVRLERETLRTTAGNEVEVRCGEGEVGEDAIRTGRTTNTIYSPSRETPPLDTQAAKEARQGGGGLYRKKSPPKVCHRSSFPRR